MASYNQPNDFTTGIARETLRTLLGEKLGGGVYRDVFELTINPQMVLKVEPQDTKEFCNVQEWTLWNEVKNDPELSRWFAPCIQISDCGSILIQARTRPLRKLPEFVPNIMTDVKLDNMGLYKGRPVFHDYGNHRVFTRGLHKWNLCIAQGR